MAHVWQLPISFKNAQLFIKRVAASSPWCLRQSLHFSDGLAVIRRQCGASFTLWPCPRSSLWSAHYLLLPYPFLSFLLNSWTERYTQASKLKYLKGIWGFFFSYDVTSDTHARVCTHAHECTHSVFRQLPSLIVPLKVNDCTSCQICCWKGDSSLSDLTWCLFVWVCVLCVCVCVCKIWQT